MTNTFTGSKLVPETPNRLREKDNSNEKMGATGVDTSKIEISRTERIKLPSEIFADVRGKVKYHEDIQTPMTDEWEDLADLVSSNHEDGQP